MSLVWTVDPVSGQGYSRPMTASEQAQCDADQAAAATSAQQQATYNTNAQTMRASLRARYTDALALADKIEAGTATAAEQRDALAKALRACIRLSRLLLEDWDVAA